MEGELLQELGTDIDSSFSFKDGDLIIATGTDNLVQAIINRLNTELDELELFYDSEYGSVISSFLGWRATDETIQFIQTELTNVLLQEPRLLAHESTISYLNNGTIRIDLRLTTTNDEIVETNFILGADGVIEIEVDEDEITEEE